MALAGDPRVLLLDEPMAGMGPEESHRMVEFLDKLKGSRAILLVEHDMDAVFALADRITVLVYGRAIATGTPAEIRANARCARPISATTTWWRRRRGCSKFAIFAPPTGQARCCTASTSTSRPARW